MIRTCQGTGRFWWTKDTGATVTAQYLDPDGTPGPAFTLTGSTSCRALCANNDETILYYVRGGSGGAVKRWDLVNDLALADFIAAPANHNAQDILILSDDSIIVLWSSTLDGTSHATQYNAAAVELNDFDFSSYNTSNNSPPRLAYSLDLEDEFWVYLHELLDSNRGIALFVKVTIPTSVFTEVRHVEYNRATYASTLTVSAPEDILSRNGPSNSCPFFIITLGDAPPSTELSGIYFINPVKRNDTVYLDAAAGTTEDREIPDPTIQTGLFGS